MGEAPTKVLVASGALVMAPVMVAGVLVLGIIGDAGTPKAPKCGDTEVAAAASGPVRLPVVGKAVVTSNFGMRTNPGDKYRGKRMLHAGIDIAESPSPTTVVAAMGGQVKSVYTDSIGTNVVQVAVGDDTVMEYLHLASFAPGLKQGDRVWAGKPLGIEGSTGNSSGAHLHFQIDVKGKPTDPRPWMRQHSVTLPQVGGSVKGAPAQVSPPKDTQAIADPAQPTFGATPSSSPTFGGTLPGAPSTATFPLPEPGTPRKASLVNPPLSIPSDYARYYKGAANQFHIPKELLEGIGMEETGHGRNVHESSAGAQGPMQFLPATFDAFAVDGDGDGQTDIDNPADAIYTAAHYLVKSGATDTAGVRKAILAYNHADWYVNDVLYYAKKYGAGTVPADDECSSGGTDPQASGPYGQAAVAAAKHWQGLPYVWGAGTVGPPPGPTGPMGALTRGDLGFDCSGFSAAVVAKATNGRLKLPHFSTSQYTTSELSTVARYSGNGPRPLSQLRPGDLVLFNIPLSLGYDNHPWNHVGVYIGDGRMIHAPHPGSVVKTERIDVGWNYEWVARRPLAKYTKPQGDSSTKAATRSQG